MKKYFTLFMFVALILGPLFFIKNKQGQPMLSLPGLDLISGKSGSASISRSPGPANQQFYKWKDASGQWHYGDTPPAGKRFDTVDVNTQANIIKSTPVEKKSAPAVPLSKPKQPTSTYKPPTSTDDALTMDRALNVINDAKAVRGMMENRNKQLENISN